MTGQVNAVGPVNEVDLAVLRVREKEIAAFLKPERPA